MANFVVLVVHSDPQILQQIKASLTPLYQHFEICCVKTVRHCKSKLAQYQLNQQAVACLICSPSLLASCEKLGVDEYEGPNKPTVRRILVGEVEDVEALINWLNSSQIHQFIYQNKVEQEILNGVKKQLCHFAISENLPIAQYLQSIEIDNILTNQLIKQNKKLQHGFFDYTRYSDEELSKVVIDSLYYIFEHNDDHHVCRRYSANHLLTQEGNTNDVLWFIASGEVMLKKLNSVGEQQQVTVMRAGSMVGGMSFITGEPAFTTGITLTPTEVIKLDKNKFAEVMKSHQALLAPFTNLLLRNFNRRLQSSISTKLQLEETMLSLDAAHQQLLETEKMAVLGQLIAGVAHELNNPVAAILRGAETLKNKVPHLLANETEVAIRKLGSATLDSAMHLTPMSTALIRQKTKQAQEHFPSQLLAKKAVKMGLDDNDNYQNYCAQNKVDSAALINELDNYYQVGNFLRSIDVCAKRIADLVKGLKHYAGQDTAQAQFVDLRLGIEETLVIFENRLKQFEVIKHYHDIPSVQCHAIELQQVWTNFVANSIDAIGSKGTLTITTRTIDYRGQAGVKICFEDNGPGISGDKINKIFDLNFTTKREGHFGLGIGLTVCQQIIARHHGEINVCSEIGEFTRFEVLLPVANANIKQQRAGQ
ncbi:ATP-binding protein [Motilimonas pumila]|uniref:histidine kinase n=1 Tax=Motilimonas pumila TaxID=2303987 RepID=A0A418YCP6_9GAMM|nr:ATP-binding protein [Motilimonas pumila]RJG42293.1 histidine kinase [Motilimonas pumila]